MFQSLSYAANHRLFYCKQVLFIDTFLTLMENFENQKIRKLIRNLLSFIFWEEDLLEKCDDYDMIHAEATRFSLYLAIGQERTCYEATP